MVSLSQEKLKVSRERLRKEQQEAEKLIADIRKEKTSWKVGGDIWVMSEVWTLAAPSIPITKKPLPLCWHWMSPEDLISSLPCPVSVRGGSRRANVTSIDVTRENVTSTYRHLELNPKTDLLVRKAGEFCFPFFFSIEALTPSVKDTGQRTEIFLKIQLWECSNIGGHEYPGQLSAT